MKNLYALVFKNNGIIFKIADEVEVTDESVTTTVYKEPNPNIPYEVIDEETGKVIEKGVDSTPSSRRNYNVVEFAYDEEAKKIVSYKEGESTVDYEFQMSDNLFWKLNNNGLYWKDNQIT